MSNQENQLPIQARMLYESGKEARDITLRSLGDLLDLIREESARSISLGDSIMGLLINMDEKTDKIELTWLDTWPC